MPRAKTVRRRRLPPAKRSKKPKIEPEPEVKKSSQRCVLIPGVGTWPPSRYTARSPSVNRTRLRRSGMRKIFANASTNFPIKYLLLPGARLLRRRPDHLRASPGLLNLLQRRFGKLVSFHCDLARQLA